MINTRADRRRKITDLYPSLLAATYAKKILPLIGAEEDQACQFHQNLRDLAEAIIKYLAIIALAQYRKDTRVPGKEDPSVERVLQKLREPSLGHWVSLLHKTLSLYSQSSEPLLQKIQTFYYEEKHQDNAVSKAIEKIQDWLKLQSRIKPPFSYRDFFELLPPYRNKIAHGAGVTGVEYKEHTDILYPAFERALLDLEFLADYSLIYVREVRKQIDRTWSQFLSLGIGQNVARSPDPLVTQDALEPEHLYLCQESVESGFVPLLDLYPLITCKQCQGCRDSAIFVLNLSKEQDLEYLSYSCGHRMEDPQHIEYFKTFLNLETWRESLRGIREEIPSPLDLYRDALEAALQDNLIDDFEGGQLTYLARLLKLSTETTAQLEAEVRARLAKPGKDKSNGKGKVNSTPEPPKPVKEGGGISTNNKLVLCWNEPLPFPVTQVALFGTPRQALVADEEGNIYVYRENRQLVYNDRIEGRVFRSVVLDDKVLIGTWNGQLYCFGRRELLWQTNLKSPISSMAVSRGDVEIVVGTWDGQVAAFRSNRDILWEKGLDDGISTLSITQDGKVVSVGSYGGHLMLLDAQGNHVWMRDMQSVVVAMEFADLMRDVIVATQDRLVTRINIQHQEILWERNAPGLPMGLLLSSNGRWLIMPCREGQVLVFSTDTEMKLHKKYALVDLAQVCLSPVSNDGRFMLGLSYSEGLWLIDNLQNESTRESDGPATCVAISPHDGQYVLLGDPKGISLYRLTRPLLQVELNALGELHQGRYTRFNIILRNTGERVAADIVISLEGMITPIAFPLKEQLEAGKAVTPENQSIQPQASGALPITIRLNYVDDLGMNYEQAVMQTLDVLSSG